MKIISVQSLSGGTGVTLTAAEIALNAMARRQSVLAVDTSPLRCLKADLEDAGFDYVDDVRHLFLPLAEGRWLTAPLPFCGLFCYPAAAHAYLAKGADGTLDMVFRKEAGEDPDAASRFAMARMFLERNYDEMVVDVVNNNRRLMQLLYDASDEIHVMLREHQSIEDWRCTIDRPESDTGPRVIARADRDYFSRDRDSSDRSMLLRPYFTAARNGLDFVQKASGRAVQL
jgi:cellulose biosynthesis protein BcsQ